MEIIQESEWSMYKFHNHDLKKKGAFKQKEWPVRDMYASENGQIKKSSATKMSFEKSIP